MARWLLDANIISEAVRNPRGALAARLAGVPEGELCTSVVAAAELRYGAARKASARLTDSVKAVLGALDVAPLEPPVDEVYGELRARLEAQGRPLGANDLWIAAHALALGCVLVTDDRGFEGIDGLVVENWLRDGGR